VAEVVVALVQRGSAPVSIPHHALLVVEVWDGTECRHCCLVQQGPLMTSLQMCFRRRLKTQLPPHCFSFCLLFFQYL
jgi:hypothetical protein